MRPPPTAIVVVPPLSPSDTNPPLGPYILRAACERAGVATTVVDLSIAYINLFKRPGEQRAELVLGDQDKDRVTTQAARRHFLSQSPLRSAASVFLPDCADASLGMHFDFDALHAAVHRAIEEGGFWTEFVIRHLIVPASGRPPSVVGLSLMGPPQALIGLIIGRICKQHWPTTPIIAGGSHITLLRNEIVREPRYGKFVDLFMPGHCERQFAQVVRAIGEGHSVGGLAFRAGESPPSCHGPVGPVPLTTSRGRSVRQSEFDVLPSIYTADLAPYDPSRVTLPLQLTRGCVYGRCSYCTYPAVEPMADASPNWQASIDAITALIERTGVRRFSFKDSLFTPKNLGVFCDRLTDAGVAISWSATTLLHDRLTPGLLDRMAAAGCRTLEVGMETIDGQGQELFDKRMDVPMIERVIDGAVRAGIAVVVNQIFGWPGQTVDSADRQADWFRRIRDRSGGLVSASCNMLEVNRASPMAADPLRFGIALQGIAPWAFSYEWSAPGWRACWRKRVPDLFNSLELSTPLRAEESVGAARD